MSKPVVTPLAATAPSVDGRYVCGPVPLEQVHLGQEVVLATVEAPKALQHRLAEMGLRVGVRLTLTGGNRTGPFILAIGDTRLVLGQGLGHCVMVYPTRLKT